MSNIEISRCTSAADVREAAARTILFRRNAFKRRPVPPPATAAPSAPVAPVKAPPEPALATPIRNVIAATAAWFGATPDLLLSERRNPAIVQPRHIAMYIAHKFTRASFPAIGRIMRGRDHTTILHGFRNIQNRVDAKDIKLVEAIDAIVGMLRQGPPFELCRPPLQLPVTRRQKSRSISECPSGNRRWSEEDKERLITLRNKRLPAKTVAYHLGRSHESVKSQAVRLGVPFGEVRSR
jgi:hypothetical protein